MTAQSMILAGAAHFAGADIAAHLVANGVAVTTTPDLGSDAITRAFADQPGSSALIVVMPQPDLGRAFLDINDAELDASMECIIDLIAAVGAGLEMLPGQGAIVVVGNRGYLGGWGGAHEMAVSGAMMGFVRSAALAVMARGIRVNAVALDLPSRTAVDPLAAASLTLFLASPDSAYVDGEIILANRGRSLLLREARNRN